MSPTGHAVHCGDPILSAHSAYRLGPAPRPTADHVSKLMNRGLAASVRFIELWAGHGLPAITSVADMEAAFFRLSPKGARAEDRFPADLHEAAREVTRLRKALDRTMRRATQ